MLRSISGRRGLLREAGDVGEHAIEIQFLLIAGAAYGHLGVNQVVIVSIPVKVLDSHLHLDVARGDSKHQLGRTLAHVWGQAVLQRHRVNDPAHFGPLAVFFPR